MGQTSATASSRIATTTARCSDDYRRIEHIREDLEIRNACTASVDLSASNVADGAAGTAKDGSAESEVAAVMQTAVAYCFVVSGNP